MQKVIVPGQWCVNEQCYSEIIYLMSINWLDVN